MTTQECVQNNFLIFTTEQGGPGNESHDFEIPESVGLLSSAHPTV
jgi:hypothetical protein